MTIRKKLLIAAFIGLAGSGYIAILLKLATFPPPKVSHCIQHFYSCYPPPMRLWP